MKSNVGQQLSLFGLEATNFQRQDPAQLTLDIHEITERPKQLSQEKRRDQR